MRLTEGEASMGIVHAISEPLARAGISIFNISTSDTDFTLVCDPLSLQTIHVLKRFHKSHFTVQ
jgi:hypothetical protein